MKWRNHREIADSPNIRKDLFLNFKDKAVITPRIKDKIIEIFNLKGKINDWKGLDIQRIIDPDITENNAINNKGISIDEGEWKLISGFEFRINFDDNKIIRIEYIEVREIEKIMIMEIRW